MLECSGCGARRVVHDTYLKFVGTSNPNSAPGQGYGGPPLHERYACAKGCSRPMKTIGSVWEPDDDEMWLHKPHVVVKLTPEQSKEWRQLIQAAGLDPGR